jgi:acyl dehydratase
MSAELTGHGRSGGRTTSGMKYWEDLVAAPVRRFGPLTFSSDLLDTLLDLLGEKHPIHDDESFARSLERPGRVVPGGFIHAITSGWAVQHGAGAAIVGMRSMSYRFVRPLPVDVEFYFTTATESCVELNDSLGLVTTVRKVTDASAKPYALGRLSVVVLRRPAAAAGRTNSGGAARGTGPQGVER